MEIETIGSEKNNKGEVMPSYLLRSTIILLIAAVCMLPANSRAAETLMVGAVISMTGEHATNGKHVKKGYNIAINRINEMGGITVGNTTYELDIKYYDDESNPAIAAKYAKRLIKKDKVKLLLGPYGTATTAAVAPIAEKFRVPLVQGNGASLSLFDKGYKYQFAVLSSADMYLSEAINLAVEAANKAGRSPSTMTAAIAVENDPFSKDLRNGIVADSKKYEIEIVIDENLPRDFDDMTFILDKVKDLKPDIFVVSGHELGADLAIRQIHEQKVDVPMLAMTHCEGADVHGKYGLFADYTLCATQWASSMKYEGKWFGSAYSYNKRYQSEYGIEPPYQAAESSAAVLVLADAIERADTLDTEAIRTALATTDVQTLFGWVKFDEYGKNIAKPMVLRQLIQGRYVVVAPSGFAQQEAVYPRPMWSER